MTAALASIAFGMVLAGPAQAEAPIVENLDLSQWADNPQTPLHWQAIPTDSPGSISRDCVQKRFDHCVVKIARAQQSTRQSIAGLVQSLPAAAMAGQRWKLSGWIKTSGITGGATLLAQVDMQNRRAIAEVSLDNQAPKGDTGWRQFSISIPVAANAHLVHLGLVLSGTGTAWFDQLTLENEPGAKVAAYELPALQIPPRPRPSSELESLEALKLSTSGLPKVDAAWQASAIQLAHPFRSLYSTDFSDLQFLKPLLKDKRMVMLGESSHGVSEFSLAKLRLIKFLHQEMGYDVVALESAQGQCGQANRDLGKIPVEQAMGACVFANFNHEEMRALFSYLEDERKAGRRLDLAGFDIQESGWTSAQHIRTLLPSSLAPEFDALEQRLGAMAAHAAVPAEQSAQAERTAMSQSYRRLAEALEQVSPTNADMIEAAHILRSRMRYLDKLGATPIEGGALRDQAMADNIAFLADTQYAGRKLVVWAHNTHIATTVSGIWNYKPMGAWLHERYGQQIYGLGLYMGRGVNAGTYGGLVAVQPPEAGSLEAVLASAGWKMALWDFSAQMVTAATAWMHQPIATHYWGAQTETLTPAQAYDGVLYIDTVTPPLYLLPEFQKASAQR
jgi:erythromycin esterase